MSQYKGYRLLWGNCKGCSRVTSGLAKDYMLLCVDCWKNPETVKAIKAAWKEGYKIARARKKEIEK